jgi:hypothetical protein
MNEREYIDSIDMAFPYDNEEEWKVVIDEGIRISDNAAYMALYEICSRSRPVPKVALGRMFRYWSARYDHPTKPIVVKAAIAILSGKGLPADEVLEYLDAIAGYPGLYNAVEIVYHACRCDSERVDKKYSEVYESWQNKREMTN